MDKAHTDQYCILWDKSYQCHAGTESQKVVDKFHVKLNFPVFYDGILATPATGSKNALYLMIYCDSIVDYAPVFTYDARVNFTDS